MTDAYVCRLLPLTCLAADIVEAILDGRQPKGLKLAEMLGNGPLAWEEQGSVWNSCGPAKATGASRGGRQSNLKKACVMRRPLRGREKLDWL